jgi:methylenetetrahydrofolate reductase (NADPH)
MRIDELLDGGDGPTFSFEFFPPKTEQGEENLYNALRELKALEPSYVSVT